MRGLLLLWALALPGVAQSPLTLHDAVARALSGPAAQAAAARVDEVRGGVRQAALGPNPRLYLSSEDLRPWADNYSFVNNTEDYGYVGQTIEVAGKRGKRIGLAQARVGEAEATRALRLRQIAGEVAAAYWDAVSLGRVAELLHDDIEVVDAMVVYHRERVDAGAMRGVDLLRMEIERDRLRIAFEAAERDAAQARLELFRRMGTAPTDAALTTKLDEAATIPLLEPAAVLLQRPDLQAAREAVLVAEADLKLQRANAVPDPDLLGGYKRNLADNTAFGGLQVLLPFRNRNQGEIERAHAAVAAAEATLSLLEAQVRVELEAARQDFEAQQRIVKETLPEMRARAKQNLQIVEQAYRIGGVDLLRFLDAERAEFDVEVTAVRTLAQLQQSSVRLQLAYGVQP